ncbi:MAG: FAD-dependent monooxygenase, partial [Alphaproteobacteria bacterium]|nr:FAD-dependent monooxygenase [Alphaproteobacteria bacterium]
FQCRRIERFRHGRVIFAGDSAHQVSPFGARGANSGLQDVDNLAWKLDLVMRGVAPEALLDSYDAERVFAADENIRNSTRSTDFIAPQGEAEQALRDAALALAERHPFARRFVNSGRLSLPSTYRDSPLSTPDGDAFGGAMVPGAPCADAPVTRGNGAPWLLEQLHGVGFTAALFVDGALSPQDSERLRGLSAGPVPIAPMVVSGTEVEGWPSSVVDRDGLAARRYDARPGTLYLLRPDQHVAARMRNFDVAAVRGAAVRAVGIGAGG